MAAPSRFYQYALELVRFYNTIPSFRLAFPRLFEHPRVTYKGYPLKLYVRLLAEIDHQYHEYTRTSLNATNAGQLFEKFWLNKISLNKLETGIKVPTHFFSETDQKEIERIELLPEGKNKAQAFDRFLEKKDQESYSNPQLPSPTPTQKTTITPTVTPPLTTRRLPFGFKLPLALEKAVQKVATPSNLATVFSAGVGGYIGGIITQSPVGFLAGAGGGAMVPSYVKNGGGQSILKGLNRGADLANNLLGAAANLNPYTRTASFFWKNRQIIIGIAIALVLIIILLPGGLLNSSSFFPPFKQNIGLAAPVASSDQIKITKTGPSQVENGANITYSIKVTYIGSGKVDLKVTDQIPKQTDFVEAPAGTSTPAGMNSSSKVEWDLIQIPANQIQELTLTVKPTSNDIFVTNPGASAVITKTYSTPIAGGSGGSCPSAQQLADNSKNPQTCQYLNPGINIFDTSFSENQIQQYVSKYQPQSNRSLTDFEAKTRAIVAEAQSVELNPIIPLGYWYTESKFGEGFGCPAVPNQFQNQLDCILGGPLGSIWQPPPHVIYTSTTRCARDKDASSPACKLDSGRISGNPNIFNSINIHIPIDNFDSLVEMIGPRAPNLDGPGKTNNNCTHTYNLLVQVAESVDECKSSNSADQNTNASDTSSGGINE